MARKKRPPEPDLLDAIQSGDTALVERLIAKGLNINGDPGKEPPAARAIWADQIQILQLLIRHGLDPRHWNDALFCDAIYWKRLDAFKLLISAVFSPGLWRGKTLTDIQTEAHLIYANIQNEMPKHYGETIDYPHLIEEPLRLARIELVDAAMTCWEHVRPDPPQIKISDTPAKGRAL